MDRRGFFGKGLKGMLGNLLSSPAGQGVDRSLQGLSNLLAPDFLAESPLQPGWPGADGQEDLPRPPGALPDPDDFLAACTACADCVFACPYGVLFSLDGDSGPVLDPNAAACRLCTDYPCIAACETGALLPLPKNVLPRFGQAVLDSTACLNHPDARAERRAQGARRVPYCKECLQACPVPDAIFADRDRMPEFADHCTGCGQCVAVCPPEPPALRIVADSFEEEQTQSAATEA